MTEESTQTFVSCCTTRVTQKQILYYWNILL